MNKKLAAGVRVVRGDRFLVVSLALSVLAVAGLVFCVVMVFLNNRKVTPEQASVKEFVEESKTLSGILGYIRNVSKEEATKYLDDKITENKGNHLEPNIKIIKVNFLANLGEYESALAIADELQDSELDRREKMDLYLAYKNIYNRLENMDKLSEYQNLYMKEYLMYSGGGAGFE